MIGSEKNGKKGQYYMSYKPYAADSKGLEKKKMVP